MQQLNANMCLVPAAMGGTYSFVRTASANLREREDPWNTALGGFFSGAIIGLRGEPRHWEWCQLGREGTLTRL